MRRKTVDRRQVEARVKAVWECVGVLRPDLTPEGKHKLATTILDFCAAFDADESPVPEPQITAAQVTEMVWSNSQCIQKSCPMLLFSDRIAAEINAFFCRDDGSR
jgi:hypothetical protein